MDIQFIYVHIHIYLHSYNYIHNLVKFCLSYRTKEGNPKLKPYIETNKTSHSIGTKGQREEATVSVYLWWPMRCIVGSFGTPC